MSDNIECCFLCGKTDPHLLKFSNWSEELKSFVTQHVTPDPDIGVCKKEYLEAKRYHDGATYIPKWNNRSNNVLPTPSVCVYPLCNSNDKAMRSIFCFN